MATSHPLRIPVADLLRRPGATRVVEVDAPVEGLANDAAQVPSDAPVTGTLSLERLTDGLVVRGTLEAQWAGSCSRCVAPVHGRISVHVDELFEREPLEGETYLLEDDVVNLEPMVRDALTLELPSAPLCREDCAGLCPTCGIDRNVASCECRTDEPDPRWAALRSLEL